MFTNNYHKLFVFPGYWTYLPTLDTTSNTRRVNKLNKKRSFLWISKEYLLNASCLEPITPFSAAQFYFHESYNHKVFIAIHLKQTLTIREKVGSLCLERLQVREIRVSSDRPFNNDLLPRDINCKVMFNIRQMDS